MPKKISDYMQAGVKAHLIGIGGVSMSPLAEVLAGEGLVITGSDIVESATVQRLRSMQIPVAIGHQPENVGEVGIVIRTAAAHDDNPEVVTARTKGIPVFERAQAWGALMKRYQNALCVAGTHGKTTTTSMCTHICMAADIDPTVMIGGTLPLIGASHRVGRGDTIVLESCEYCNSFLSFSPTIAVILNVEEDHMDFFQDLDDILHSFRTFAELTPLDGAVVANFDDANTMKVVAGLDRRVITFGMSPEADIACADLHWQDGLPRFDIIADGARYAKVALRVPGMHNVMNALAAAAAAFALELSGQAVEDGLAAFRGAARRMEYKGAINGADVFDDYAHHPAELRALLSAVAALPYQRVICAFQPHTYTRTHAFFDDFVRELKAAEVVLLAEIYAAREENTVGISSKQLAEKIPHAQYFSQLSDLKGRLRELAQPGDLILTVGAGNIYQVGEELVAEQ
jgi:UDP-N-acetylmuramate--alanine ligase